MKKIIEQLEEQLANEKNISTRIVITSNEKVGYF